VHKNFLVGNLKGRVHLGDLGAYMGG